MNVESCCHDDAVTLLKNAGDSVQLTLKYFEPASGFLSLKGRQAPETTTCPEFSSLTSRAVV